MRTLKASKEEIQSLVEKNETFHFKSEFNFLNEHRGFRPGSLHLFLGCTGAGKSTLVRTLVLDYIKNNSSPLLIYLTEEKTEHFVTEVYKGGFKPSDNTGNIIITSELEKPIGTSGLAGTWLWLTGVMVAKNCKLLVIDNITTSEFYNDQKPEVQSAFAKKLLKYAEDNEIAIVAIAHTKADVSDNMNRLINENDIRGSKSIVNMCQFMYIMQRFKDKYDYHPTIRIIKSRSQLTKNKIFKFRFDEHSVLFKEDWVIDFETFNECFAGRERLTNRKKSEGDKFSDIKINIGGQS